MPRTYSPACKQEAVLKMKGLYLGTSIQKASLRTDFTTPVPGPGEALIRVLRSGICGTGVSSPDSNSICDYSARGLFGVTSDMSCDNQ
jgi:hypothetical protein